MVIIGVVLGWCCGWGLSRALFWMVLEGWWCRCYFGWMLTGGFDGVVVG